MGGDHGHRERLSTKIKSYLIKHGTSPFTRHIIVTDSSRTRRLAEGERTQPPQAELHQPSPYSDLESESMCRAMRHSAIVTWSQNSRVSIIVLISPKLEWATKVKEIFVVCFVDMWEDAQRT